MLISALSRAARHRITFLLVLTLLAGCYQLDTPPGETDEPVPNPQPNLGSDASVQTAVPIIFDTDLGFDCDDAGALAVLHKLTDRGEAQLLATMSVVGDPQSAAALDVINTYYGRPDVPIGAYKGDRWTDARPYWYKPSTDFLGPLVSEYESSVKGRDEVPDAVALYRQVLAAQPDRSVTVVALGFSRNLVDLLASSADASSSLSGRALVAKKVERLVYMGSRVTPVQGARPDFNLGDGPYKDGRAAQSVVQTWPTEIVFASAEIGDTIKTGERLQAQLPQNPVARVYDLFPGIDGRGERASWDLTAVLYAVRGGGDFWRVVKDEHLEVAQNGVTRWQPGAVSPGRYHLEQTASDREIEGALESLLN